MDMHAAYKELGTYRAAAALCSTTDKTVKRAVTRATVGPWVGQLTRRASPTSSQVANPTSIWRHRRPPGRLVEPRAHHAAAPASSAPSCPRSDPHQQIGPLPFLPGQLPDDQHHRMAQPQQHDQYALHAHAVLPPRFQSQQPETVGRKRRCAADGGRQARSGTRASQDPEKSLDLDLASGLHDGVRAPAGAAPEEGSPSEK